MGATSGILSILFLSGLLGSLGHCLGMCGPLVLMVGVQLRTTGLAPWPHLALYHGARLAVYSLLGAIAGTLGSLLRLGPQLNRAAGVLSLVLGALVLLFGLAYLGWRPLDLRAGTGGWLNRAMGRALQRGGRSGALLLGALNGLLPCGLVYSALLVAATAGGPLPGLLGMASFGAGTVPALLLVGAGAGALSARARQIALRVAGGLIVLVGVQLALRGMAALGWVPSLRLGGLVLW